MVGLGDLPGGAFLSAADDVSADGSVIVGQGVSASGFEAFRWTSGGGMVGLGDLPGGAFESAAWDVSADGSVTVGHGTTALGAEAFVWTSAGGMQNLRDLLIAGGATGLAGWRLTQASAITPDGRTIVGSGRNPAGNPEAWLATIPEPSTLTLVALTSIALLAPWARRRLSTSMKKTRNRLVAAVILALPCLEAQAQMTFTPLGHVGGSFGTGAFDVSADGSVVVGGANFGSGQERPVKREAFRWTREDGMVGLGDLPGGSHLSAAYGVSADGSVIVGQSSQGEINGGWGAFRWTSAEGMVPLGWGTAWDVSADGSVVVGEAGLASGREAFRWTPDGGMVGLGDLPGEPVDSAAYGVSADGSVVVGIGTPYAFRWTSDGGMVRLNDLSGLSFDSHAQSVSADGSVIVGVANMRHPANPEAFRWTSDGGMVSLGQLPGGGYSSIAFDVSADGSIVVGSGRTAASDDEAFLWTSDGGMRNLRELLIQNGASGLTGWTLTTASAITPDGRTIVGTGINPAGNREAWLVTIPEPSTLTLAALTSFALLAAWARRR
jgi:probable HAF family extracellular repeat protein